MKKKNKYYVVLKGRSTGIFDSWQTCQELVKGYPGAQYMAFDSWEAAKQAFDTGILPIKQVNKASDRPTNVANSEKPIMPSVAVDAACSGVPGVMEYRGVQLPEKKLIFARGPYHDGTNNIGEFLAIVLALSWLKNHQLNWPVYSDSATAISWIKARKCRTQHKHGIHNQIIFQQIAAAEAWLQANPDHNAVLKWLTDQWGEIPADYGRK